MTTQAQLDHCFLHQGSTVWFFLYSRTTHGDAASDLVTLQIENHWQAIHGRYAAARDAGDLGTCRQIIREAIRFVRAHGCIEPSTRTRKQVLTERARKRKWKQRNPGKRMGRTFTWAEHGAWKSPVAEGLDHRQGGSFTESVFRSQRVTEAAAGLKVLGLEPGATSTDIGRAYRRAALVAHPDKGGTAEAFRALTGAYNAALAGANL